MNDGPALAESVRASSGHWLPEAVARGLALRHGLELADVHRVACFYRDEPRGVAPPRVLSELPVRTPGGETTHLGELGAWALGNELDLIWEHRHRLPAVRSLKVPPMPQISVITPCYNGARFVGRTIESLQAQTFRDWEHIVVDDGSTDDSASVIAEYAARDPRVQLIRQPNGHVCKARNAGFAASDPDSPYLLFLDADDILEPRAIEKMLAHLDRHPRVGLAYCSVSLIGTDDQPISAKGFDHWWHARYAPNKGGIARLPDHVAETGLPSLLAGFRAIPSTAFIRREVFETTAGWDESFRDGAEDLDLVVQLALMAPVHFLPLKLVRYRRHDANFSNQDFGSGIAQFRRKWWSNRHLDVTQQAALREAITFANELPASALKGPSAHNAPPCELGRGILQLCGAAFQA